MNPVSSPVTIHYRGSAGCGLIFPIVFIPGLSMGVYQAISKAHRWTEVIGPVIFAGLWLPILTLFFLINRDLDVTVDADGIVVTETPRYFVFFTGSPAEVWRARWDAVGEVADVERYVSTRERGIQKTYLLKVGEHTLNDQKLGCFGRTGLYAELLAAIRKVIGERLVVKEELGDVGDVARLLAQKQAEREARPGSSTPTVGPVRPRDD